MQEGTGKGLRMLAAMAGLGFCALGAWGYEHAARTSRISHTWPAGSPGEAYATIEHTAPWSPPWTKVCRVDEATHAERWCRSVPDAAEVHGVTLRDGDVIVELDIGPWHLDPETGANRLR